MCGPELQPYAMRLVLCCRWYHALGSGILSSLATVGLLAAFATVAGSIEALLMLVAHLLLLVGCGCGLLSKKHLQQQTLTSPLTLTALPQFWRKTAKRGRVLVEMIALVSSVSGTSWWMAAGKQRYRDHRRRCLLMCPPWIPTHRPCLARTVWTASTPLLPRSDDCDELLRLTLPPSPTPWAMLATSCVTHCTPWAHPPSAWQTVPTL